jgi:hypothetical protein
MDEVYIMVQTKWRTRLQAYRSRRCKISAAYRSDCTQDAQWPSTVNPHAVPHRGGSYRQLIAPTRQTVLFLVVACTLGCIRFEQAQSMALPRTAHKKTGCIQAIALREKHPNPNQQQPRFVWIPIQGNLLLVRTSTRTRHQGSTAIDPECDLQSPDRQPCTDGNSLDPLRTGALSQGP